MNATWGNWYWVVWLAVLLAGFLPAEIFGLVSNTSNTLSAWVWRMLKVMPNQDWVSWTAEDFLVFGCWLVLVSWLTGHFFFGRFR